MKNFFLLAIVFMVPIALAADDATEKSVAIFAGGCFWCMEPPFDKIPGVIETISGYTGGRTESPTYELVSSGRSGHYEALKVVYNPNEVDYKTLLNVFWRNVDPFDDKGQFCDKGPQYRSAIFYLTERQRQLAEASKQTLSAQHRLSRPFVTQIIPATAFFPAEEYHQNYYLKNSLRYKFYRFTCGRDRRLEALWDQ